MSQSAPRRPNFLLAITPVVLTLAILGVQIFVFDDFSPHVPLAFGLAITAIVGVFLGHTWLSVREGAFHVIHVSLPSVSVLIVVGMLIGVWISSGTVPTLIYYGLNILSPNIFLVASMIICAIVSVAIGTSWGTVGTVGLALMGIGAGFDIPTYFTAGAVVSGSFFGDKISPLSDTTNLAPAVTGTNVFDHIKNMMPTTVPAMLIAIIIYAVIGVMMVDGSDVSFQKIDEITAAIDANFYVSPVVLLPAVLVIWLALSKQPPIPSLFAGVVAGGITAYFAQGVGLHDFFTYANYGYTMDSGVEQIDSLLTHGGIQNMMWTISLILIALAFGGALERTGCLQTIIRTIMRRVSTFAGLQTSAILTSTATNLVAGDPYLSIALPGRMYAPVYRGMGYSTLNLSRGVEEGGTLMSPLIPWNAGGSFVILTLGLLPEGQGMTNLLYIPLSFACWLAPVIGITYAFTGWFSPKATDAEKEQWKTSKEAVTTRKQLHQES